MTTIALPSSFGTELSPHLTALAALQQLNWSVFPLDAEKRPLALGENHPDGQPKRLRWSHFQTHRASPDQVRSWQMTYHPSAWAVITGTISKIVLLDFDGDAGYETRLRLGLTNPHVQTGSGGHHVYFRHPGWLVPTLNSKASQALGRRWPGLDIRADGGYAAFCGQNSHGPYRWLRPPELEEITFLPDDLRRALGLLTPPETSTQAMSETAMAIPPISEHALITQAQRMVRNGRGRNNAGFWLACQLRDHGYSIAAAHATMSLYVAQVPTVNSKGQPELYTHAEAIASVKSAFKKAPRGIRIVSGSAGAGGNGRGAQSTTGQSENPAELPDLFINQGQFGSVVDQAVAAIVRQEEQAASLFVQSCRLVRVSHDEAGRPFLLQMSVPDVREVLTHSANIYRIQKGSSGTAYPVPPPNVLAEQILARPWQLPYLPLPTLVTIVETPVVRADGSILDRPGYDPTTQLYYAPSATMATCKIPLHPTLKEREEALALLMSTIGEFPYVSDADKANALGLLLTPLMRSAIPRHVPMALIDAPKQGTGKGLLSDLVSIIATGSTAQILTMPDSEEELQKLITTLLIEGASIITIDNIAGKLQSRHLDAVLTSDQWRGRILGASKSMLVPQRATWLATGNNIKLGGDLVRRCYRIRLDAKVSRPYMRKGFTHKDLAGWVTEHRAKLIGALLTLARAWYDAGTPHYEHLPALGTFSSWVNIIGGILEYAGVPGFLCNLDELYEQVDEDGSQWEAFFHAWHETIGEAWVPLSTIVEKINAAIDLEQDAETSGTSLSESLPGALQIALTEKPRSFSLRLAKAFEKLIDTCFGADNLRLEKRRDMHTKNNTWRVVAVVAVVAVVYSPLSQQNSGKDFEEDLDGCEQKNINININDRKQPPQPPQPPQIEEAPNRLTDQSAHIPTVTIEPEPCSNDQPLQPLTDENEMEEFYL